MPKKRTIRDVTIERARPGAKGRVAAKESVAPNIQPKTNRARRSLPKKTKRRERRLLWSIVTLVLLIFAIFLANVFGGMTVIIVPEKDSATLDSTFTASREAGNNQLRFDVMVIEDSVMERVAATESTSVERKASGQIVIFNENSSSQRLREETRFETPEGLVFKTAKGEGITVPGGSADKPGSLEVTVYADEPGDEYNIDLTDFVIPGWREINDSRFETQYARSKTAMTGGFVGIERSVDPAEQERVGTALREALSERLTMSAEAQKTDQFVFFEQGTITELDEPRQGNGNNEEVELIQEGSLTAILFNKQELSELLAREVFPTYADDPVMITNFEELTFTLENNETFEVESTANITFELSGEPKFEWIIDRATLKEKLSGAHKRDFQTTLREFSGINRAELSMKPFWKIKIPDDETKIDVDVVDSEI